MQSSDGESFNTGQSIDNEQKEQQSDVESTTSDSNENKNAYYQNVMNIENTQYEKPNILPPSQMVELEWDEQLCENTGTYCYKNRFDEGLVIHRYPKYVNIRRAYKTLAKDLIGSIFNRMEKKLNEKEFQKLQRDLDKEEADEGEEELEYDGNEENDIEETEQWNPQ